MPKRRRKSLSLRLQPYEGTPLAEVADYLNSLDRQEANQKAADVLAFFLPYARKDSGESDEEVERAYWSAYAAIEKLFYLMAQELRVKLPQPQVNPAGYMMAVPTPVNGHDGTSVSEPFDKKPSPQIQGKATAAEVDVLFGD